MLKKLLSVILVVALVVTTASVTPSVLVEAKAKKKYVKSIKVSQSSTTISVGKTKKIGVKVKTKGKVSKKFTVSVKNSSVASVSKKGKKVIIKGKKAGRTKVTVKSKAKNKKGKRVKKTINVYILASKKNSGQVVKKKTVLSELLINDPDIDVGVEKVVIFTGDIENGDEESYPVVKNDGDVIGYIYDDGFGKDEYEGDGIYTGEITLFSDVEKEEKYYVLLGNTLSGEYATAYYYTPFTEAELNSFTTIKDKISQLSQEYDGQTEESARSAYNKVLEYVKGKVAEGEISSFEEDFPKLSIKLSSGAIHIFSLEKSEGSQSGEKVLGEKGDKSRAALGSSNAQIGTFEPSKAGLYAPEFDNAANKIVNYNSVFEFNDNYDNSEVSVEKAKTLDNYNIILWNGHGYWDKSIHSVIWLGTKVTKALESKYRFDRKEGCLVTSESGEYGITAKFINKYYTKKSFKNSMIYLGTCDGADDDVLANTFKKKGVAVFLGFRHSVSTQYNRNMFSTIFDKLTSNSRNPVTVDAAVNSAKSTHGYYDGIKLFWFSKNAELRVIGNKNYTLNAAAINAADKYDIVLTWGADPCDMDSHLEGYNANNEAFHVYYGDDEAYENGNLICQLDYDDTESYGPETVSLKTTSSRTYYYYVHRFEGDGSVNTSQSTVKVYKNGVLKHTYNVNEYGGNGDYWNVFAIKNGRFVVKNTITEEPDTSY